MNYYGRAQWILLGTAEASAKVWGIQSIDFPCGYQVPPGVFSESGTLLERPGPESIWAMGGLAFEIEKTGKNIEREFCENYIAGYYPWVCVFHDHLLDELAHRGHTIEMWDRGLNVFHGLWRQSSQMLGHMIGPSQIEDVWDAVTIIECSGTSTNGGSPSQYVHKASEVVHFMSKFMTLSQQDLFVLGPLVATRLRKDDQSFTFRVGDVNLYAKVDKWKE